jgi:hypothetical protein
VGTWTPSTPEEDQRLIDLWKFLEQERKAGRVDNWLHGNLGYTNLLYNCWTPVLILWKEGLNPRPPITLPADRGSNWPEKYK